MRPLGETRLSCCAVWTSPTTSDITGKRHFHSWLKAGAGNCRGRKLSQLFLATDVNIALELPLTDCALTWKCASSRDVQLLGRCYTSWNRFGFSKCSDKPTSGTDTFQHELYKWAALQKYHKSLDCCQLHPTTSASVKWRGWGLGAGSVWFWESLWRGEQLRRQGGGAEWENSCSDLSGNSINKWW